MLQRIHINQHHIKANAKGANKPVISVKAGKSSTYGNQVEILDEAGNVIATVVYSPDKPLSCGARVWIETRANIRVDGQPLECTGSPT